MVALLVLTWCEGDDVNAHGERVMEERQAASEEVLSDQLPQARELTSTTISYRKKNSFALSVNPTVVGAVHDDFFTERDSSALSTNPRRWEGKGHSGTHSRRRQTAIAVTESADVGEEVARPLARSSYPHKITAGNCQLAWEIGPAFNWSWKIIVAIITCAFTMDAFIPAVHLLW